MRKKLFPENDYFFKANLHCHTTVSDGLKTPQEIKAYYLENGYSIVAFTDHNKLVLHNELSDEKFLAVNGYEETYEHNGMLIHLNLLAKNSETDLTLSKVNGENINDFIAKARAAGFFVVLNHPEWSSLNYEHYCDINGLFGIEIYNRASYDMTYRESAAPYERLIKSGKKIFAIAADDNHNLSGDFDSFGGFVMINAKKLDYPNIVEAMSKGDFYASSGPLIYSINWDGEYLTVLTSEVERISMIENITLTRQFARAVNGRAHRLWSPYQTAIINDEYKGKPASKGKFILRFNDEWWDGRSFIIAAMDCKGNYAYSNPFLFDDLKK